MTGELSKLERRSRVILNFNNDGRWGLKKPWEDEEWRVLVRRPRQLFWARSTASNKVPRRLYFHAVKYQIQAQHKATGTFFTKTIWLCGASSYAKLFVSAKPARVCARCYTKAFGHSYGTVNL